MRNSYAKRTLSTMEGSHHFFSNYIFDFCLRLAIFFIPLLLLQGCRTEVSGANAKDYSIVIQDSAIFFDGQLIGDAANDLGSIIKFSSKRQFKKVIIRSPGGHSDVGVKVGQIIHQNSLDVEVYQYCVSTCASKVLLAGKRKILTPGSITVFHPSSNAMSQLLDEAKITKAKAAFAPLVTAERKLFRQLNLDAQLLFGGIAGMIPICAFEISQKPRNDPFRYGVSWRFAAWLPSKNLLEKSGVRNLEGEWPSSAEEANQLASQYFNNKFTINYVDEKLVHLPRETTLKKCVS